MMMQLVGGRFGSHIPLDLIWQAVLGVTDQHQRGTMLDEAYLEYCAYLKSQLQDHLTSDTDRSYMVPGANGEVEVQVPASKAGNIEEANEYRFFLHRHWYLKMLSAPIISSPIIFTLFELPNS